MKRKISAVVLTVLFVFGNAVSLAQTPLYKNKNASVEERVSDILKRMTLEEKIGQMCQYVGLGHIRKAEKNRKRDSNNDAWGYYKGLSVSDIEQKIINGEIGSFLHVTSAEEANYIQRVAMKSRLQIPILFGIDAIHGSGLTYGATVYPAPITISATWDVKLARKIAEETAEELRALGLHWTFTPNVDVARDPRWGRVGETFGEDPFLVSRMGVATVLGFQNNGKNKILACAKHMIAGSEPENGLNGAPTDISERKMREIFLPPYKATVNAGVYTVMAAHNELNGIPCHADKRLLTDILRGELGFKGFVVSDWMDIERIYNRHRVAESPEEADLLAVNAGVDMHMHGPGFFERVLHLVKEGKISERRIDEAVIPVLRAKFELGLFDNPFADEEKAEKILFNEEHRKTALQAAREGIILLKNENEILPVTPGKYKRIFVTGPNADTQTILGDWALKQPDENVTTVVEGFRKIYANKSEIVFYDCGKSVKKIEPERITEAARIAKSCDLAVLVLGENPLRYMPAEKTEGENVARSDIKLPGNQLEFVKKIYSAGIPIIAVLINGRPLGVEWIAEHIPAIVEAGHPGNAGGEAIAEIIAGKVNPSGKLTYTVPRSVGQIISVYNHKPSSYVQTYVMSSDEPLWHFGYGLSYTEFEYSRLKTDKREIGKNENFTVSVYVKNAGEREGEEIVQLYIRDDFSSVTRPVKELKDFKRIRLKAGETKKIDFVVTPDKLAFYNAEMKYVVEPGTFTVMVGSSSRDEDLIKQKITVK